MTRTAGALRRYALVGVVATGAHYALLLALAELLHWPAWLASGAGAAFGAQLAYVGNRWLTFAHQGPHRVAWPRFQLTAALGAVVGMVLVAAAQWLGLHYLIGQLLATLLVMLLTFAINRRWSFAARPAPE
jgi:putative flippase GtrA